MAEDGKLERFLDTRTVEKRLLDIYLSKQTIRNKISEIPRAHSMFSKATGTSNQRKEDDDDK